MPQALMVKPIVRNGYRITCFSCGYTFDSVAKSIELGHIHCAKCRKTNLVRRIRGESKISHEA